MEEELRVRAIKTILEHWNQRDRLIALCVADYTDMALGLGETRLGLSLFACSSANVSHAHERAARMGHEAGAVHVEGSASEDFKRMLGIVARAWSKNANWSYRYLEVLSLAAPGAELGLLYAKGDLRKTKPNLHSDALELRRLVTMYGVETSEPSPTLLVIEDTSKLVDPSKHPQLWAWLAAATKLDDKIAKRKA